MPHHFVAIAQVIWPPSPHAVGATFYTDKVSIPPISALQKRRVIVDRRSHGKVADGKQAAAKKRGSGYPRLPIRKKVGRFGAEAGEKALMASAGCANSVRATLERDDRRRRFERVQHLYAATREIGHVPRHQHQVVHPRRGGEADVALIFVLAAEQPGPLGAHRRIDRYDPAFELLLIGRQFDQASVRLGGVQTDLDQLSALTLPSAALLEECHGAQAKLGCRPLPPARSGP
jgi:hypothetical protein